MDARAIDHVNVRIPADRVDEAVAFYRDGLGFETENLQAWRDGERPLFSFRLCESSVVHVSPTDGFEPPTEHNYRHYCIVLDADIDDIKTVLDEAGIEIDRESNPLGATGRNPAVYVTDPFGYKLELKAGQ
ncbi:VOC family protein [Haloarchaeobius sp. HRN-SO-5]|uniref:VOC family protein n=1 Tax=Haloarchaeobius sp. HRN-SO-5 TaxID=3446118 RepID=UPI003EC00EA8